MVYNKTKWQDEIPDLTKPILDTSGKQKTDPQTGRPLFELVQTGTRITSAKLNNIEDGIESAHTLTERLAAEVTGNFVVSGFDFTVNGLAAAWKAGVGYVNGRRYDVPAGSLTLTTKQGQYIYLDSAGTVQKIADEATARAGLLLWYFATDASKVITNTDSRRFVGPESYAFKSETVSKEAGKGLSANDYTDSEKAKVQQHDERLSNILPRLNTPSTNASTLQAGIQTIEASRDAPFNLTSLTGRLLLNLLGRAGTFDYINGWTSTGGTSTVGTTNILYGTTALLFTLSGASGRVSRSVTTVAGSRYLAAVEVRLGTATGAYASVTGASNGATVNSTTGYTITYVPFTASATTTDIGVTITGANGQTAYVDGFRLYELSSTEYSAIAGMTVADVAARYPYTEGLAGVRNPYAIRWTTTSKTEIAAMLAFGTELLAAPVSTADTDIEMISQGADGQYYKNSSWAKLMLSGDQISYIRTDSATGYKGIRLKTAIPPVKNTGYAIKFDGSILARVAQGSPVSVADQQIILDSTDAEPNSLIISVSNADAGWGDSYSPTAGEVAAYFYGWVMYDGSQTNASPNNPSGNVYNGTGTKAWAYRTDGVSRTYTGPTATLPTTHAPLFTPYELLYKRSVAVNEPIVAEGALNLVQGDNVIEVGSGLVIRESARPQSSSGYYFINGATTISSALSNKVRSFVRVYKDGREDRNWESIDHSVAANQTAYGLKQSRLVDYLYSASSAYAVTYFTQALYPVASFVGNVPANERSILERGTSDMQQVLRRLSVVENKKADKDGTTFIAPTMLNTWSPNSTLPILYRKKDTKVSIIGVALNGATSNGTVLFRLPDGYRPKQEHHFAMYAYTVSDGSFGLCEIIIRTDGNVVVGLGGRTYISLSGIEFAVD